jgi:hypothetical protein
MKTTRALTATCAFAIIFCATYLIHVKFFSINVVFYAAIADAMMATALTGTILYSLRLFSPLSTFEKTQMLAIWMLAGYAFAISVPTVIDRSLSFYILEKLQQRGGGIKQDRFRDVFTQEYLPEHRLVDVRLTEQLESGTIVIQNGCVKITPKGESIARFSRFYRQNLLPKKRLLMGQYSDDLTNPFRHQTEAPDYTCH